MTDNTHRPGFQLTHLVMVYLCVLLVITVSCGNANAGNASGEKPPDNSKKPSKETADESVSSDTEKRGKTEYPRKEERQRMVSLQIKARGVTDQEVLDAMRYVPRHAFVPDDLQSQAYDDNPLPIGYGQTISQPYIVALMTEKLGIDENSKVLEIGTGSGYQAAILAEIAKDVYTIEIVKGLYTKSTDVLNSLGYKNTRTKHADGFFGWEEYAPFDAIVVTAASDHIPPPLIKQLKPGGRMCIPIGPPQQVQRLVLVTKDEKGKTKTQDITAVRFVPLTRQLE